MNPSKASQQADKNLTNVVSDLEVEGVNAHQAQQLMQDREDERKRDIRNQRK